MNPSTLPPVILLVEDNPGDIELTGGALKETGLPHQLSVARDGVEAMEILDGCKTSGEALPRLILLDLNLPRRDGRELLRALKSNPTYRKIPVVIYSGSEAEDDVKVCYALHANAYVSKPEQPREIVATMRALISFWFDTARVC